MKLILVIFLGLICTVHCGLLKGLTGTLTQDVHKVSEDLAIDKDKGNPLTGLLDTLGEGAQNGAGGLENALGFGDTDAKPTQNKPDKKESATTKKANEEDKLTTTSEKTVTPKVEKDTKDATPSSTETSTKKNDDDKTSKDTDHKKKRSIDDPNFNIISSNDLMNDLKEMIATETDTSTDDEETSIELELLEEYKKILSQVNCLQKYDMQRKTNYVICIPFAM